MIIRRKGFTLSITPTGGKRERHWSLSGGRAILWEDTAGDGSRRVIARRNIPDVVRRICLAGMIDPTLFGLYGWNGKNRPKI